MRRYTPAMRELAGFTFPVVAPIQQLADGMLDDAGYAAWVREHVVHNR